MSTLWEQQNTMNAWERDARQRTFATATRYIQEIESLLRAANSTTGTKQLATAMRSMSFSSL